MGVHTHRLIAALWPYHGKRYMHMFPLFSHQASRRRARMAPPAPPFVIHHVYEGQEKPSEDAIRRITLITVTAPSIPHRMLEENSQNFSEGSGESTPRSDGPDQYLVSVSTIPPKLPTSKPVEPGKADDEATTGMSISPIPWSNMIENSFIAFSVLETLAERASRYSMNLDDRVERDVSKFATGGYAIVYQGTLRPQETMVAIKTFRFGHKSDIPIIKVHDVQNFHHGA